MLISKQSEYLYNNQNTVVFHINDPFGLTLNVIYLKTARQFCLS